MEEVTEKDRPGNCPYRQDNTSCMDKIRLFRGLPEKSREKLMAGVLHRSYEAGHVLIEEEEKVRFIVVCLTDVDACLFSREEFMRIITGEPEMALGLIAMLSTELTEEKEKVMLLSIRDPDTRLAGFLLDRDEKCLNGHISMKLSDIAASISLRQETVSRSLTRLQKAGYLERTGRGELKVTDRQGLLSFFRRAESTGDK